MHFHLPKPLHGWREFAGEVGIIVVGVLIALGAEQVVETIHWQHQVRAEREALDNDVQGMWAAMSGRQIIQACVDRRLGDLALVFARHEQGKQLGIIAPIGRPWVWTGETSALQMASADGTLAHMSFEEKNRYFGVQSSLRHSSLRRTRKGTAGGFFRRSTIRAGSISRTGTICARLIATRWTATGS